MFRKRKKKIKRIKLPTTSKMVLIGAVLLCLEIIAFCEYVVLKLQDTSFMYVLIGIPASLIPVVLGYFYKSKAENTVGGIIYDKAMLKETNETIVNDELNNTDIENDSVG